MRLFLLCVVISIMLLSSFAGCSQNKPVDTTIHVYTRSDACGAAETWAKYLNNSKQEDLKGIAVFGDPGLAEAVARDRSGIGFNNIGFAYDVKTGDQLTGLCVIPIDVNENGRIDADEDFYGKKSSLVKAIAGGRFPSPPARDLHLVTKNEFKGLSREFVRWILSDGQKYVDEMGYVNLPDDKIKQELNKLGPADPSLTIKGVITVSGAWALYPMVVRWAEEYQKAYPGVKVDISAGGAGKGMVDALSGMVDLGMISREIYAEESGKGACWASVVKDAVVPVTNRANPLLPEILSRGLTRQAFIDIWITGKTSDWKAAVQQP